MQKLHRISGILVSLFIFFHLFNHVIAWYGIDFHHKYRLAFGRVYHHPLVETLLILAFVFQVYSGLVLCKKLFKKPNKTNNDKIQLYSGIGFAFFIIQHVMAVFVARLILNLKTDFYFAAQVVNQKPLLYYFVPYYFLGIVAVGLHIANIHRQKISKSIGVKSANIHFYLLLSFFFIVALLILYIFMGGHYKIVFPNKI